MDLDSSLLRAFVIVADELHFHRAAGRLFISQQALSKRIVKLETLLGVRLFDRGSRAVALTTAGKRLLPTAREAVEAIDAALDAVEGGPQSLTVDVLDEHLAMLPAIRQISQSSSARHMSVVTRGDAHSSLRMLRHGVADIVLGRPGALDPSSTLWPEDIRGLEVLAEPIRLLVPVGHHLDRPGGIRTEDLQGQNLWFPTVGAPAEWSGLLAEFIAAFNLTLDPAGSTLGYDYWLGRIAQGSAPASFIGAAMDLPAGLPVSAVPITMPTPVFLWWGMWRRRLSVGVAEGFLRDLRNALAPRHDDRPVQAWVPERDRPYARGIMANHVTTS